jgi:hypothetical protein
MSDGDHDTDIEAENVNITTPHIVVNMGWSPRAVFLNNLFSGGSMLGGTISVSIVIWEVFFN